jgi:RND family efflux transporter MFP subunit
MVSSEDLSSLRIARDSAPAGGSRRVTYIVIAVVLVLGAVAVSAFIATSKRAIDVTVATAAIRGGANSAGGLTANGYVVARTKASVSSKLAGRLAYLGVEEGDRVTAGAILARLESAEYEAFVRQAGSDALTAEATRQEAEAAFVQAERTYERARALGADSLLAPQVLDDARSGVDIAAARLRAAAARVEAARHALSAAEANLENTLVRAPFTGTILRRDAEVGEVVAPSVAGGGLTRGAVVTMADLSTLEVEVDVNEAYIGSVRADQPAAIVLDAYPSDRFPGHVRQVVPTADRQKATVLVRVAIDSGDPRILPEMGARVVFQDSAASGVEIAARVFAPAAAVRNEAGADVVYVVVEERAQRRTVQAGPVMGDEREVRSGLAGGETLIVDPPADLTDGARVRVETRANQEDR